MGFFLASLAVLASIAAAQRIQPGSGVEFYWSRAGPSGLCITASGTGDGANVVINQCHAVSPADQTWLIPGGSSDSDTGPTTQIRVYGSKCLDVREGVNADGTKLQLWGCYESNPNQQFVLDYQHQTIRWGYSGKCVDLTAGNGTAGNQLQVWTCNSRTNPNQWWNSNLISITPGVNQPVRIQNNQPARTGPCLAATSNADGAAVVTQDCGLGPPANRQWVPVRGAAPGGVGTGPVTQIRIFGNKCLDVAEGRAVDGTQLQIWSCGDNNPNQNWQMNGPDGTIVWAGHNFCVDLTEGNRGNGTRTQIWTCWGGNQNQAWHEIVAQ